jgi:hypothetical protein
MPVLPNAPLHFGQKRLDPKVRTAYERLEPSERRLLTQAFRKWIRQETLGYTLLGVKPMSYLASVQPLQPVLSAWQKVQDLMNRTAYAFNYVPQWKWLFFAHTNTVKTTLTRHAPTFQQVLKQDLPPEQLLSDILTNRVTDKPGLFNAYLQGILYGYGAQNAYLYELVHRGVQKGEAFMAYDTILVRRGPLKRLTPKQAEDVGQALIFNLQSGSWNPLIVSQAHRHRVIEGINQFLAIKPKDGPPKALVFEILDRLFAPHRKPEPESDVFSPLQTALMTMAPTLELEPGFRFSTHLFETDRDAIGPYQSEDDDSVLLPRFRACPDDTEPVEMMTHAARWQPHLTRWLRTPAFFKQLLNALFSDQPEQTLKDQLSRA